jgi:hypothetical protein
MTSATARPVAVLARRDAPDAPTHLAVVLAAERTTVALNAARAPPTVVLRVRQATSRTVPVEVVHRDPVRTRER